MFRSQDRNQDISSAANNFDCEENFEFSGATLKITTDSENKMEHFNNKSSSENPAVLSGTDVMSPSPTTNETQQITGNETQQQQTQSTSQAVAQPELIKPKVGSPRHFFSFRKGLFEQSVNDCINILLKPTNDTDLQGSWLLTEISHWDHEKEKIIILTSKTILLIKYDFIAMRILDHFRFALNRVDTIVKGKLSYPASSIVPHLEGITNGLSAAFRGELLSKKPQSEARPKSNKPCSGFDIAQKINFKHFHPVERNELGIRMLWNKGQPLSAVTSWNPFATSIPWKTLTNHPLFDYIDPYQTVPSVQDEINENKLTYSVENLHRALVQVFTNENIESSNVNYNCVFEESPIVLQNYLGIGAVIHNKHNFGFFKVRGKFSF